MAPSNDRTAHNADIEALFEGIGTGDDSATTTQTSTMKNTPAGSDDAGDEEGVLGELSSMVAPRTSTSDRPNTPQAALSTASTSTSKKSDLITPTTGSARSSEEEAPPSANNSFSTAAAAARTTHDEAGSADEQKILQAPNPPAPGSRQTKQTNAATAGSSWWGGISAMASAAVKQAEAAVKEIQKNEEAIKWAEQVRENYGALRGLGGELKSRALPTFTTLLHTIAPPISQHERLQIHITHDFINYPSLDPIIYQTFSRVMSQVEGGDLMVIQRGSESSQKRTSVDDTRPGTSKISASGWNDGPWWRQDDSHRDLGLVKGLVEGTKLVRASAEAYGTEFFAARGGVEEAAKQATVILNESNPVRSSDIFLAIQAIGHTSATDYFASGPTAAVEQIKTQEETNVVEEPPKHDELVSFAVYLHDPIHGIAFSALSQSFPQKWADWIDAKSTSMTQDGETSVPDLPDEILAIITSGGVDPREWISEWLEEIISLAVGVVAQRYVARRMGVGEGGLGRGKRRELAVESGAGEAARAL